MLRKQLQNKSKFNQFDFAKGIMVGSGTLQTAPSQEFQIAQGEVQKVLDNASTSWSME